MELLESAREPRVQIRRISRVVAVAVLRIFPRMRGKYGVLRQAQDEGRDGGGLRGTIASKDESPCDSPPPSRCAIHLPRFAGEELQARIRTG